MTTLVPEDFQCWCNAEPNESCQASSDRDRELEVARWHQKRMIAARDGNVAIQRRSLDNERTDLIAALGKVVVIAEDLLVERGPCAEAEIVAEVRARYLG